MNKVVLEDEETGIIIEEIPRFRDRKGRFVKTSEVLEN